MNCCTVAARSICTYPFIASLEFSFFPLSHNLEFENNTLVNNTELTIIVVRKRAYENNV